MAQPYPRSFQIGVDIGGTFTDVVCLSTEGDLQLVKVPTTRADPSIAVQRAVAFMADSWGVDPAHISRFVHGTTAATNAVLERKGAKTGLITTDGFKDVLEIGRQMRHRMYDMILHAETPGFLAPGARRKEVAERISAAGEVVIPLDEQAVIDVANALAADGVEAIAVCFLFSFINPAHELRAREIINHLHPEIMVSLSCEVDPAFREYERTTVTTFDAYVKPVLDRYLANMERNLVEAGITAPLQIMQSRGGICSAEIARRRPVRLFLSGPAAGVIGARMAGQEVGLDNLITVDIGGTSCDIAVICEATPVVRSEGLIDGYPVRVPMVDVNAIGAGGGSIAWLDSTGGLRVGPQSAGSEPGPACYERGGENPTVTDASVVLGYINPDNFAGGSLKLNARLAWKAIDQKIAKPTGFSVEAAALGIHRVLNAQMVEGIRLVSIRRGFDPRKFNLLALGGGGALHATALANELGISTVIVPRHPGVLCAYGLLAAPIEHEMSAAFPRKIDGLPIAELAAVLSELDLQCRELMELEGIVPAEANVHHFADVCYVGQSYHLEVPLFMNDPTGPLERLYDDFLKAHDRVYGHSTKSPAKIVNLRSVHQVGGGHPVDLTTATPRGETHSKGHRNILVSGAKSFAKAAVYDREALTADAHVAGPAIIEQVDTTILLEPGWVASIGASSNLLLTRVGKGLSMKTLDRESNAMDAEIALDPVTVEVVRNKLDGIANEMELTLLHSSFSPIVKEGLDASAGLFTADGSALAQACAIPAHLGSLIPAIAEILKSFPVSTMAEGDAFVLNDPYTGGTHLPDLAVVMPVFSQGQVIAISATITHHQDVGGMTPGSVPPNATEIYQEGIRIPPMKLLDRGAYNETLVRLLRQNVRMPDMFMGDLNAEIAACTVGARRIADLAAIYGIHELTSIFEALLDRSESMTRQTLRQLPQGTFRYVDFLDNDGVDLEQPIRIEVAVTIADGNILFDLTGTSPQVKGPMNCVLSAVQSAAFYAVRALTDPEIPNNGGCFRPISMILPEGTVVNPVAPAAVNARGATMKRIAGCMVSALAQAMPERVPASSGSELLVMAFGGKWKSGGTFVIGDLIAAGTGAARAFDGVDVMETDVTNCMNLPAEAMELESPIRINRVALHCDSGGPGRFRGGLGVVREYEVLEGEIKFSHRGERHYYPAKGLEGGLAGAVADSVILRADGRRETIPSKAVAVLAKGDRVVVKTAGGGGVGDPRLRNRDEVIADMLNGKVSKEAAQKIYGLEL